MNTYETKKNGDLPAYAGGIDTVLFHERGELPAQTIRYQAAGLTKRELFAAMAMQGICTQGHDGGVPQAVASNAVHVADKLLAELAKDQP